MADRGLEKLLAELEATFEASIAREEEAAAQDLGFALSQDNSLRDVLPRLTGGAVLVDEGTAIPIARVGTDYVVTHAPVRLVPLRWTVTRASECDSPPESSDSSLLLSLRRLARRRTRIEVDCISGERRAGLLLAAGEDYLALGEASGQVFIALGNVRSIRPLCDPRSLEL